MKQLDHLRVLLAVLLTLSAATAAAQGIKRSVVERADVSVPGREAVVARIEIEPGATAGRHTHPGDEIAYVTEGEGELLVEGRPARHVRAGDAFVIPAGTVHDAHNSGAATMRVVGVYVVEKGKPLATPAK